MDSEDACAYIEILEDLSVNSSQPEGSFLDYTKEWTEMVSRGGLFKVNNHAYRFFYKLEIKIQSIIVPYATDSTRTAGDIISSLEVNNDLMSLWDVLSGSLSVKQSKQLFRDVTHFWLTIRVHALAKEWIEQHKVKAKKEAEKLHPFTKHYKWHQLFQRSRMNKLHAKY